MVGIQQWRRPVYIRQAEWKQRKGTLFMVFLQLSPSSVIFRHLPTGRDQALNISELNLNKKDIEC